MSVPLDAFERVIVRLRDKGFTVGGYAGWRARDYKGRGLTPTMIVEHHTGSKLTPDTMLAITGNGITPGPLCNFTVHPDGRIVAIAVGYSNHAGYNDRAAYDRLLTPPMDADVKPAAHDKTFSANRLSVGIEVKSSGSFTDEQHAATAALEAALVIELGLDPVHPPVVAHRELTPRKIDPVHSMWQRRQVVAALCAKWTAPPKPEPVPLDGIVGPVSLRAYQWLESLPQTGGWDADTGRRFQEQINTRLLGA